MTEAVAEKVFTITVPLRKDEVGGLKIGQTRIPLERVIYAYNQGETPEQIVYNYDTLDLVDVYAVISFYLQNREEVEAYMQRREREAEEIRREIEAKYPPHGLRERLLARRAERSQS
jgi:uncharacterized protein (DUF433 family)